MNFRVQGFIGNSLGHHFFKWIKIKCREVIGKKTLTQWQKI
ncbi:MAG: hypothetical protein ACI8ZM_000333 [Crocinitomix sp.]|jgi:hypothetical protein